MYESFFGMQRRPFSATPDPGCFFSCESVQAALDELIVCFERGQGIGILSAPAGMGKTLLCQHLVGETPGRFEVVYLGNSNFPTRRSLLQAILFEMGDEYSRKDEAELRVDLRSRLLSIRPAKEAIVLVIDEAHLFADELLEEVRTLADIAHDGSSLVRVILSAQPELEERLTSRSFDALNQRISNQVYLESLTLTESHDYLAHRVAWAGASFNDVFTREAVDVITRASDGMPRCLNQLADHSLLLAFASDQQPVARQTVCDALEDLKQLPLHWNDVSTGETVVGWQDDEENEDEDPQMPETDTATPEILDVPPRVTIELDEPGPQADELSQLVAAERDSDDSNHDAPVTGSGVPIAPSAPAAVIEFGEPLATDAPQAADATDEPVVTSEAAPTSEVTTAEQLEPHDEVTEDEDLAEPCDNVEAEESYADLQGLCFEINATGCEFESVDCQVDDSGSADESSTELATESAEASSDLSLESSTSTECENEVCIADVAAPATPVDVVAVASDEDDVRPNADDQDAMVAYEQPAVAEAASFDLEFGLDSSGAETTAADETAASEPMHALDIDHTEESVACVDSMDGLVTVVDELDVKDEFEEEVVIDHYSAIAEPQSTGIIWNLVGSRRHEVAPADVDDDQANAEASSHETGSNTPVHVGAVTAEPFGDIVESTEEPHDLAASAEAELSHVSEHDVEEAHTDSESVDGSVSVDVEDSNEETIAASDSAGGADSRQTVPVPGATAEASEESVTACNDDVMEVQPDSRIDAIVPLLNELSGNYEHSEQLIVRNRSMLDIEAELVQTVSHGQPEMEDEIGAAILDMCLDTQAQIQAASQSVNDEATGDDGDDAALMDDVPIEEAGEAFGNDPFDIVQPENPGATAIRFDSAPPDIEELHSPVEAHTERQQPRPFGRLFSELRRRQRRAG
jgi:type II secretory pathway predicted ATPase ExeA